MKFKALRNWIRARTIINGVALLLLIYMANVVIELANETKQALKSLTFMGPEQFQYLGEYETTAYSDRFAETIGRPPIIITEQTGKGVKKIILKTLSDDRLCTASGLLVEDGAIAISRDMLESGEFQYGERLWIPQLHKSFTVMDKMGPKISRRLDVFSFNRKYVDNFGVKKVKIYKLR